MEQSLCGISQVRKPGTPNTQVTSSSMKQIAKPNSSPSGSTQIAGPLTASNISDSAARGILSFIASTFNAIDAALDSQPPGEVCVKLKRLANAGQGISSFQNTEDADDEVQTISKKKAAVRQVRYAWPGNSEDEARRFACVLAILLEVNKAVRAGTVVTKRDIYYCHPELFRKQAMVDRYIDDIALTCGVTRHDLKVTASPKALICGLSGEITNNSLLTVDMCEQERVQLLPTNLDVVTVTQVKDLCWVLLVEKEATFKSLVESYFDKNCSHGRGLLITTKGYPDLNSLVFVRHIISLHQRLVRVEPSASAVAHSLPVFSLTDCDPDGLDIHRCYVSAPKSLAVVRDQVLDLPVQWLGVNLVGLLGDSAVMNRCLPMNEKMRSCLQTILMLGKKMEIQAVDAAGWLNASMASSNVLRQ